MKATLSPKTKPTYDTKLFSDTVNRLRTFFLERGFLEVHTQDRLSILAACEDPETVSTYGYENEVWPLPQTGQMWLEYELLTKPELPGVFCVSTSYRNEPNPIPGRHERIFPMFEFEAPGTMEDLVALESALCSHMGLGNESEFAHLEYEDAMKHYHTDDISAEEEMKMKDEFGRVVFLKNFPEHTSPFWNMNRAGSTARKVDVIIDGMETIGSAERSSDRDEMKRRFATISDGEYAALLYEKFGEDRVKKELKEFFELEFFPRFGGGIGMTRMMRACQ